MITSTQKEVNSYFLIHIIVYCLGLITSINHRQHSLLLDSGEQTVTTSKHSPCQFDDLMSCFQAFYLQLNPPLSNASREAFHQLYTKLLEIQALDDIKKTKETGSVSPLPISVHQDYPLIPPQGQPINKYPTLTSHLGSKPKNFSQCDLSHSILTQCTFRYADLWQSILCHTDLSSCDLFGANLWKAKASHANFSNAILNHANLSIADLQEAHLLHTHLQHACLSGANLKNAVLRYADLSNADLTHCHFSNADLTGANLQGATLFNADLSSANLTKANLTEVNLSHANLSSANLNDAVFINANLTNTKLYRCNLTTAIF